MTTKKKRKPKRRPTHEYTPIVKYLEKAGWKPIVIGPARIEGGNRKFRYQLVVEFTGGRVPE